MIIIFSAENKIKMVH